MALNLNRGVMTKFHPSGLKVSMYIDDPGTYLDDRGDRLDEAFAKAAGFDLDKNRREKLKQLKLAEYKAQLDREYASHEERLATELSNNGGHDVRHIGGGQYALFDKDGAKVMVGSREEIELLVGPIKAELQVVEAS
jgi:hypothetical protein